MDAFRHQVNITGDGPMIPNVIPGQRACGSGHAVVVGRPGQAGSAAPELRVIKRGDVVEAIDVACSCGRLIRIICQYP